MSEAKHRHHEQIVTAYDDRVEDDAAAWAREDARRRADQMFCAECGALLPKDGYVGCGHKESK